MLEKFEKYFQKLETIHEDLKKDQQEVSRIVDAYLRSKINSKTGFNQVLAEYREKYNDIFENNYFAENLTDEEKTDILKRIIYLHEIRPFEKEEIIETKKAA